MYEVKEKGCLAKVSQLHLRENHYNPKIRLSKKERKAYHCMIDLEPLIQFWKTTVTLKQDLLTLIDVGISKEVEKEANALAYNIISTLNTLADTYHILGPPLIHNLAIKAKLRKRGYCYHYVSDLFKALQPLHLTHFELHWAGAYKGSIRESNALAIVAKGHPFASGMVIDAWRSGGKPFWTAIEGDSWPWQDIVPFYITP